MRRRALNAPRPRGSRRRVTVVGSAPAVPVAGDVLSVTVNEDGWHADVLFKDTTTGGTAAPTPDGTPKLSLLVTSLGFDDTGAATTITRTVVATKQLRKPSPNQAQLQEAAAGSDLSVRFALSDYVYAKDKTGVGNSGTAIAWSADAGLYTGSNAGSGTAVNNSTVAYPRVVGNWAWPGRDKVGASITPRCVAFHASARQGRPVRCVKFTATGDTSAATVTQTVTALTVDGSVGDAVPVPEYVGSLSTSSLTQGELVTLRFQAFPWIGDDASVLDTSTGTVQPTPLYGPIRVVCDKTGAYSTRFAVVDAVSGNDATGAVGTGALDAGAPPAAYATISGAYNAVRTANNTAYGRNNAGGSIIYLRAGNDAWLGATPTVGVAADAWLTISRYPGDAVPVINAQSGGKNAGSLVKFSEVSFTVETTSLILPTIAGSVVWHDRCTINQVTSTTRMIATSVAAVWHITRSTITSMPQGIRSNSTNTLSPNVIRGNTIGTLSSTSTGIHLYTFLGNKKPSAAGGFGVRDFITGQTTPLNDNAIFAFNHIVTDSSTGPALYLRQGASQSYTHGLAVVQNVLENTSQVTPSPVAQIADDETGGGSSPVDNVLVWHNVFVGQRFNYAYNAEGTVVHPRRGWSMKANIVDDHNIKTDTFGTPNADRIGNWPVLYGANASGNALLKTDNITVENWPHEYAGRGSIQRLVADSTPTTYPGFVDRKANNGLIAGAGGGNYKLQTGSPLLALTRDFVLAYDLAGQPRAATDAAGAYAA